MPSAKRVPWYDAGMKPVPQLRQPPAGSSASSARTTKPGRFSPTLPRPYSAHAPNDGRPGSRLPVFIWQTLATCVWPSAWQLRTTARSSAHSAMCGYQSLTHRPDWPCL